MTSRQLSTLVCAVTPFTESGTLDEDGVSHLMNRFAEAGIGTYIGGSSPGEGYSMSLAETEKLFGIAKTAMAGRQPVRAMGIEPHSAIELLPVLRLAESVGLDGVQLYSLDCGHGNTPTASEQEQYFRTLLEATSLPTFISSHFASGYLVPLSLLDSLLNDYPHIGGINVTSPDPRYLTHVVELSSSRVDVHVGGPLQALTAFAVGAQGFLSADGNIVPRLCASLVAHQAAGKYAQAQSDFSLLMQVFRINEWGGSMRWLKAAMAALDLPGHHLRAPFIELDEVSKIRIKTALDSLDLTASEHYG